MNGFSQDESFFKIQVTLSLSLSGSYSCDFNWNHTTVIQISGSANENHTSWAEKTLEIN